MTITNRVNCAHAMVYKSTPGIILFVSLLILSACGGGGGGSGSDGDSGDSDGSSGGAAQTATISASSAEFGDGFGWDLDLSRDGSTLIAAGRFESSDADGVDGDQSDNNAEWSGATYIFVKDGSNWEPQAYLKAADSKMHDQFGWWGLSLSADGNTAAVGAYNKDSPVSGNPPHPSGFIGAVFVYVRNGTSWTLQTELRNTNWLAAGHSIALSDDGNTLAISGSFPCIGGAGSPFGSPVYIYVRTGINWTEQACINIDANPDNSVVELQFDRVDLSGDGNTLVAGVTTDPSASTTINGDESDISATGAGSAYVFVRNGTAWTQEAYLKASNADVNDLFGATASISGDGDTIAIGAGGEASSATGINGDQSDNSATNAGAVYVYSRTGGVWTQQAYIKASNMVDNAFFGADDDESGGVHLSDDGNKLAVIGVGQNKGLYRFERNGSNWSEVEYIAFGSDTGIGTDSSMSGDGDVIAVGAPFTDSNAVQQTGVVYIYE